MLKMLQIRRVKMVCYIIGVVLLVLGIACILNIKILRIPERIPEWHSLAPTTYRTVLRWPWGQWIIPLICGGIIMIAVEHVLKRIERARLMKILKSQSRQ